MGFTTFIIINFSITFILTVICVSLIFRIKKIESKSVDISSGDIVSFVEQMREMIIESESTAERLESTIKEREALLEDLIDLLESKIKKLNKIAGETNIVKTPGNTDEGESNRHNRVYSLLLRGKTEPEIASELGISIAEVELILNMFRK